MVKILTEDFFHGGDFPVYTVQGIENSAVFKLKEGIANVLYEPAHANPDAPEGQEGKGKLIGKWLYNEQSDKQEGVLKSGIELFMDSSLEANATVGLHAHSDTEELYYILEGQVFIELIDKNGKMYQQYLTAGDTHLIQPGESHFVSAGDQGARFIVVAAKV